MMAAFWSVHNGHSAVQQAAHAPYWHARLLVLQQPWHNMQQGHCAERCAERSLRSVLRAYLHGQRTMHRRSAAISRTTCRVAALNASCQTRTAAAHCRLHYQPSAGAAKPIGQLHYNTKDVAVILPAVICGTRHHSSLTRSCNYPSHARSVVPSHTRSTTCVQC